MIKLCTFPGQGTPIPVPALKSVVLNRPVRSAQPLLKYAYAHPSNAGSIAVSSAIFYQAFMDLGQPQLLLLGHSLGELTCLWANGLFNLEDLFRIANYRNDLMIEYTQKYLRTRGITEKFGLWALSSPKVRNLQAEIQEFLQKFPMKSISIANANSQKQCVVSGITSELEASRAELHLRFPRLRITELNNPDGIPFHNNAVLRPIQEPLYDFIRETMKKNGTDQNNLELKYPILSNLDGHISKNAHAALEKFVRSSNNMVRFTDCCETINKGTEGEIDEAVCMGPSNVVYNLIRRNCRLKTWEFSSLESIQKYETSHISSS